MPPLCVLHQEVDFEEGLAIEVDSATVAASAVDAGDSATEAASVVEEEAVSAVHPAAASVVHQVAASEAAVAMEVLQAGVDSVVVTAVGEDSVVATVVGEGSVVVNGAASAIVVASVIVAVSEVASGEYRASTSFLSFGYAYQPALKARLRSLFDYLASTGSQNGSHPCDPKLRRVSCLCDDDLKLALNSMSLPTSGSTTVSL
ncbi:hypothetical protein CALVIDRAFT_111692 [Calocera viscosa TUFC12733]|uniref:Uncharacterized protein n=1 Tax=Calocera viscosa (strain TUFC12733) TaxID=1330018 RepID=A0A167MI44_CALVF|nr:hypothetical protein CALVIDRAFT_111692 [Calocera viscosa TUFC12733]